MRQLQSRAWRALLIASLALLGAGCPARSGAVRSSQRILIPRGCGANLAGPYIHSKSPSFRYLGEDDGGTLVLYVRREGMDGGTGSVADPGNTRVVLARTPQGFVGQTLSIQPNGLQVPCPVALPSQVTGCDATGITVKTLDRTAIDEQCHTPAAGPRGSWVDERLLRAPAAAP